MAPPVTPWGKAVDAVMADGDWHSLDELVDAAGHLIPPGVAIRRGEAEQARFRTTGTGPSINSDDRRDARGRRQTIRGIGRARLASGKWERRIEADRRAAYRLVVT